MSKIISQSGYGLPCSGSIFSNIKPCFHDILFALLWKRWNLKKSYLLKNEDSQHIAWLPLRHQQGQKHQPLIDHQLSTYNLNLCYLALYHATFFQFQLDSGWKFIPWHWPPQLQEASLLLQRYSLLGCKAFALQPSLRVALLGIMHHRKWLVKSYTILYLSIFSLSLQTPFI